MIVRVKTVRLSHHSYSARSIWTGDIYINKTECVSVVFSTGSPNTWIRALNFRVEEGSLPKAPFHETLVEGEVYQVPVTVAGIEVEMDVGRVTQVRGNFPGISGFLGLGYGSSTYFHTPTFYRLAINRNLAKESIFAFDFGKAQPEVHFDGVDKDRFTGEIEWHPLFPFQRATAWTISKCAIDIGKEKNVLQGIVTKFDTGLPGIFAPAGDVVKIQQHIPKSMLYNQQLAVPCGEIPKISFRWGAGDTWELKLDASVVKQLNKNQPTHTEGSAEEEMCTILGMKQSNFWTINPAMRM